MNDAVRIDPLHVRLGDLTLTLDAPIRRLDPAARDRLDRHWGRLTAENPRLFDGPILSAVEIDPAGGRLHCRRATYRELVAPPDVHTGVMQVSVTGLTSALDPAGHELVLLARRSPRTRIYGSMWELAPSGGIDPPPRHTTEARHAITGLDVWRQLMAEVEEELALDPAAIEPADPICLCTDPVARSIDIVLPVRLPTPATPAHDWEYLEAQWVARADLRDFARRNQGQVISPTLATLAWLGWAT